jgi:hypothetical protein
MNSFLLPVHYFTTFQKTEITNRMECLLNNQPEACMYYCQQKTAAEFKDYGLADLLREEVNCYEKLGIAVEYYGTAMCNAREDRFLFLPMDYILCLKINNVELSNQGYCNLLSLAQFYEDPFMIINATVQLPSSVAAVPGLPEALVALEVTDNKITFLQAFELKYGCFLGTANGGIINAAALPMTFEQCFMRWQIHTKNFT